MLVREGGVEPPRAFGPLDPKSSASASFATLAEFGPRSIPANYTAPLRKLICPAAGT